MLRFLFWTMAVVIPCVALGGNENIGQWEFRATRLGVYLFLIVYLFILSWNYRKLEMRIRNLERILAKSIPTERESEWTGTWKNMQSVRKEK